MASNREIYVFEPAAMGSADRSATAQTTPLELPSAATAAGIGGFPFFPPLPQSTSTPTSTSRRRGGRKSSSSSSTAKPFAFPTSPLAQTTASSRPTITPTLSPSTSTLSPVALQTSMPASTALPAGLGGSQGSAATSQSHGGSGMSGGEIAAAVVVPVVVVAAAIAALAFFLLRRRRRQAADTAYDEQKTSMDNSQMGEAPQIPPLSIPRKAIPTGSQFGTGYNTRRQSTDLENMPTLPEKDTVMSTATATHASSTANPSVASSIHRDPFETPYGSEGRGEGFLSSAGDLSPIGETNNRVSTIHEADATRNVDEISTVSDLSYQDEDVAQAEVSVAQRASVIHMGSGNSPRGSTGDAKSQQSQH